MLAFPQPGQVVSAAKMAKRNDRFTGREIMLVNPTVKSATLEKTMKASSLHVANFRDFKSLTSENAVAAALKEADGVLFDSLKIAVLNSHDVGDQVKHFIKSTSIKPMHKTTEPERYVYALAKQAATKTATNFVDDAKATWGIHAINVLMSSFTGKGVRIAILDSGMKMDHPDFLRRIVASETFAKQPVEDKHGHGTHCVGIAAGGKSKANGFRYGVAPGAKIMVGKVLKNNGEGEDNMVLAGIEWALTNNAKIISMSLGSPVEPGEKYYTSYETAAQRALRSGTLVVAAAGNDSERSRGIIMPVNHPANCPSVFAVAAVDSIDTVADFSCAGSRKKGDEVNIAAPGVDILSSYTNKSGYAYLSGTSMATPYVAGLAALLWEKHPNASATTIWKKLIELARRSKGRRADIGAGIVHLP